MQSQRYFLKCAGCKRPYAVDLAPTTRQAPYVLRWKPGATRSYWHEAEEIGYRTEAYPVDRQLLDIRQAPCPHCGAVPYAPYRPGGPHVHRLMGKVRGSRLMRLEDRPACDGRCTNAPGPNCECRCGGVNHGTGRLVTVEIDAGPIPRLYRKGA